MESNNIYKTYSVYEQLKGNEQLLLPNMSYVEDVQKVCLQDEPVEIEDLNYFYIEALEDNLEVAFITDITENILQYSTDKETWHTLNPTYNNDIAGYSLEEDFEYVDYTLPINANEKIWFKGKLKAEYIQPDSIEANVMPTDVDYYETFPVGHFYISKPCNVGGNIFSLTYGNDFTNKTKFKDIESFKELFAYNNIVDASNLILPATKLTTSCYEGMFVDCHFLIGTPQLPATMLVQFCYDGMFSGCTSLTTAPELPATTLAHSCYQGMFSGCISLTNAPELPATTLAECCYQYMFSRCTSLTDIRINVSDEFYGFYNTFNYCESLSNVYLVGDAYEDVYCVFEGILEKNINVYCTLNTYAVSYIPSNYTINITDADFVEYKSLVLNSANNVNSKDTYTIVEYTITETYNKNGEIVDIEINNCGISNQFEENTSSDPIERTVSFTYKNAITAETTITQAGYVDATHKNYLCITALTDGIFRYNNPINKTLYYSQTSYMYADGSGWEVLDEIELFAGQSIYIKGNGVSNGNVYNNIFYSTCKFDVSGNIMSLIYGDDFEDKYELTTGYDFKYLFAGVHVVDASQLILPATTLADYCYYYMFRDCTSLATAPELPATTLVHQCYWHMFDGCTSLATAPELPATTLAEYCYQGMFYGCTSLVTAPSILPATELANYCYAGMFEGCTSLITVPELPATTLAYYCYCEMFKECTSLVTSPELPTTTLATYCYFGMFEGCTSLVTAPELPATTLTNYCYDGMFRGCTSLTTAPELPATVLATYCYGGMFSGCTSLITVPELPATTLANSCYSGMFTGCTSLVTAPELPATTLASSCYICMFINCTSLVTAPELPATTAAWSCYESMFSGCTSLTTAPQLPATTISYGCYQYMFSGCTSLVTAPSILPAAELESFCYQGMFSGCTSLTTAPKLPATTPVTNCYSDMFANCVVLNNVQQVFIDEYNCYGMFDGVCETGTIVLDSTISRKDINEYLYNVCSLPKTWTIDYIDYSQPLECKSLSIVPQNETVGFYETSVKLNVTTIASYITTNGIQINDIAYTFVDESDVFGENTEYNDITRTVSYNKYGLSTTAEVTQRAYKDHVKQNYMYITALENCTIYASGRNNTTVYYSRTNHKYTDGSGWYQLGGSSASLKAGETIYIKGSLANTSSNYGYLYCENRKISVGGNIMSLIYGDDFEDKYELPNDYAFYKLFDGCKRTLVDASQLILPATTLTNHCYNRMFYGCTSLINGPKLPATTLAPYCYKEMFYGCTSLTCMGGVFAEHYASQSCESMFDGCTSLINAPYIAPIKTLDYMCCAYMFRYCRSLMYAPELPATKLKRECYYSMFYGCTSLVTAPKLPATTVVAHCYEYMFYECTSLINAPELPATTCVDSCYYYMFMNCTSLITAPELPATTLANCCYKYMFSGCTSLTNAPSKLPATTLATYCYDSMFFGCTSLTTAPVIHANTLADYCYDAMFYKCKNLNKIIYLGNSINTQYTNWLYNVSTTGTFVINKNIEPEYGVNFIPDGWTVETIDMDNVVQCYELYSVTADNIKCQDTKVKISYSGLFRYVSEYGTYEVTKETTGTYVYSGIPVNETSEDIQHEISFTLGDKTVNITVTQLAQEEFEYSNYLCITSLEDNNNITFSECSSSYYIESSTDNITYASDITYGWKQTTSSTENIATLQTGDSIYIRGNFRNKTASSSSGIGLFASTGKFNLSGNIMSLLDNYDFENIDYNNLQALSRCQFSKLFSNTSVVDASQLVLPATTLSSYCYYYMFRDCTSLVNVPELPATELAERCYTEMFGGCTSLVNAPELPATELAEGCYYQMFYECSSLVNAPQLHATTLAKQCYEYMFYWCSSLTTAPQLPATILAVHCYSNMFYCCTSLTSAPQLPATTLAANCYAYMFYGCTSFVTAPELPATELAQECYSNMFNSCTSLVNGPSTLPATTLADYCYESMFDGCTSLLNAPELPATTLVFHCYDSMFSGCTSLTSAPQLPATTLAHYCYDDMFSDCTSLVTAPELPATEIAERCYSYMFKNCTSLVTAPSILPATTLRRECYYSMFNGCTSLITAPKLPAASLTSYCYCYMFFNCKKLSNIIMLATSFNASYMDSWVYGVASTGTFYKYPTMTSFLFGPSNIPVGWNVLDYGEIIECTSLTITAPNVSWRDTNTTITYTAIVNINIDGIIYENMQQTGTLTSEEFPQNMDPDNTVEHTLSYTYMGITATTTITQGAYSTSNYTINLNNKWQLSTSYPNLDESQYDGIYESFSNRNQSSTNAVMYVNISGYTQFRLYIGSYGEGSYDYTIASVLDGTGNYSTTSGFQYPPTSLSNFKEVVYNNIDGGEHTITITYRKDGSVNSNNDRGYLLIPKNQ